MFSLFATYRPHAFSGAALRDRLARGPPCGRKWTRSERAKRERKSAKTAYTVCTDGSSPSRDSCSGRHQTGTKPGEWAAFPKRQPQEKEMSVCTKRPSCPEGNRPRASVRQIAEQVSVLFLLKLKLVISALSILGKTFSLSREHMEANGGSTLLSRLVFRWTRDQERMATQWATTLKSCSGQQQELDVETVTWRAHPPGHCHITDGAQTTRTFFFVEGTHVHWQATAEQFFFSKFNMHIIIRKRGSASYIVRQWLLWEVERERERRLWHHWYHAQIVSDHAYDYLNGAWTQRVDAFWLWACRALELRSACKDKELGAWALDWAAGLSDWWTTMGKWKLCVRWSDCCGSPSSISLACFKQEE